MWRKQIKSFLCEFLSPCQGKLLNEWDVARFSGILWDKFVISQSGSSSDKVGGANDGGEEEDEDGDGHPEEVEQQLLRRVFSCRKLALQSKPWWKEALNYKPVLMRLEITWSWDQCRVPRNRCIFSHSWRLQCGGSPCKGRSCWQSRTSPSGVCCWTGWCSWCRRHESKNQALCCTLALPGEG